MERIHLKFHGQSIAREDQSKIKAQISYHMGDAPSDASICCCISQEQEGFACNIQVHSAKGHLFIHRESRSLKKLLEYIYDSMSRSFGDWHKSLESFSKKHPLQTNPCRGASHRYINCPINAYSNLSEAK